MYMVTGLAWVMCDVLMNRPLVNCFREAFLAKVAEYQQCGDEVSSFGAESQAEHTERREGAK